ncbi:MAG TPA: hypothetical protein VI358_18045 [Pseudolabrys sp.]
MSEPITRVYNVATVTPGPQTAVSMDYLAMDTAIIAVSIESGAAVYGVEFTLDNVNDPNANVIWFSLAEMPFGTQISTYATTYYPFRFLRLNIQSMTGTLVLKVAQATTPAA